LKSRRVVYSGGVFPADFSIGLSFGQSYPLKKGIEAVFLISFFYKGEREREREREREFEFTSCFRLNCRIRARFPVIGNMLAFLGDGGKGF